MLKLKIVEEAIGALEHGMEAGNIIFQIPDDEDIITVIMIALQKQIPKKPHIHIGLCPSCATLVGTDKYWCTICGQRLK